MFGWFMFSFLLTIIIFKMGQVYERGKPEITYKFTCLQPRCLFELETSNHEATMKLANAHAEVHRS